MNRKMDPAVETIVLVLSSECSYISSSLVREIYTFNGKVANVVLMDINQALHENYSNLIRRRFMMRRKEITNMTITAIFIALLIVQTFVPNIGYVRILPALPAITTIPLTIAIYGNLMGPKWGAMFGLIWGLTRLVIAYTQPGDMVSLLLFQNPVISLVPSVFAGYLPGLINKVFRTKDVKIQKLGYVLSGAATSLTNTVLVIGLASLFFMNNPETLTSYLGHFTQGTPLFMILMVSLGMNGLCESVFTAIIVPIVVTPLNYVMKRAV